MNFDKRTHIAPTILDFSSLSKFRDFTFIGEVFLDNNCQLELRLDCDRSKIKYAESKQTKNDFLMVPRTY